MTADAAAPRLAEAAPAKVNLTLHLRGRRDDGYHLLDSLVVFPQVGDHLAAQPGERTELNITGPFAAGLETGNDNLVLRAARLLSEQTRPGANALMTLEKALPIASGIGGGSSDAAAALRILSRLWNVEIPADLALSLGADVPVCLAAPDPQRMQGIGEHVTPAPSLPDFWMVLVNPGVAVPTGAVFRAVEDVNPPPPPEMPDHFSDFRAFAGWLQSQRNDLQAPAISVAPAVSDVLAALSDAPFHRMSGSGATCFALFETQAQAQSCRDHIAAAEPGWWVVSAAC